MVAYSFRPRFVMPIRLGLGMVPTIDGHPIEGVVEDGSTTLRPFDPTRDLDPPVHPKTHTIRARGRRRHARPGELVQLYCGMRTPSCFMIGVGRCNRFRDIRLDFVRGEVGLVDLALASSEIIVSAAKLDAFARSDGFGDWGDMREFWREEHDAKRFAGVIIDWEAHTDGQTARKATAARG